MRPLRVPRTGCALLALALAACQAARGDDRTPPKKPPLPVPEPVQTVPPEPTRGQFEHDMMVRFHMHENFSLLRAIEKLLIRGKLDDARALARSIAESPDEPGLASFAKRIAAVRDRAGALATATTIEEACRREARVAEACAQCHVDAGVLPEFREPPPAPPDHPTLAARMARHLWATDRLWEGVVGDSDESWRAGLDVLAATPLPWGPGQPERTQLAQQLQRFADQARHTQARDRLAERAKIYGNMLATCVACHASTGTPPGPAAPAAAGGGTTAAQLPDHGSGKR